MSGHQQATIEDTVYFWFAANDTSGSGGDGSTPLFDVREAGAAASAAPLLSGIPALLTHANYPAGCHEIAVDAFAVNGFAAGDTFAVFCTLAIDSQNPSGFVGSCTLTPLATSADLAAAQTDLDTLTAGVILAASQTAAVTWAEAQTFEKGIVVTNSNTNGIGLSISGDGSGSGVLFQGGSSGGRGLSVAAGAGGIGMRVLGGTATGDALVLLGQGTGDDLVADIVGNITGNLSGSVGSNLELGPAEVNAEMDTVLKSDTITDLSNGAPPDAPTFEQALMYLYSALTNQVKTNTVGSPDYKEFYNGSGTIIWRKQVSDDGATYTETEGEAGS